MVVEQRSVRILNKVFSAGFTTEKQIIEMTMDDILSLPGVTIVDIRLVNDLQKAVKANRLVEFLGGGMIL